MIFRVTKEEEETMADQPTQKTLEMRIAELEDKLSKLQVSEEDMKTYHRVSAALGGGTTMSSVAPTAGCIVGQCISGCWTECRGCVIRHCIIASCQPWGGIFQGGGGFGTLGS